mgnify:CR=1 FL=1
MEARFAVTCLFLDFPRLADDSDLSAIRRAALQGDAGASFALGVMYAGGHGVPQDYKEALKWYRRSAHQRHADALYYLSKIYAKGQGVAQDYDQAITLCRQAGEQGHTDAQTNLGVMYAKGLGVLQNYVQAYKWFNLAVAKGSSNAKKMRNTAENKMTQDQIDEAKELARVWETIF